MVVNARSIYPLKRLHDAGVALLDGEHKVPKSVSTGYPYITLPNIKEGRLDLSNTQFISGDDLDIWTRKTKPQGGDIILTRRGRVGETAVVPSGLRCAIGQDLIILRSDNSQVDQSYLHWALHSPFYKEQLYKFLNVGAAFSSLKREDIPNFEIPVPPLSDQHAIARILDTLDDKIELNCLMNETLEAIVWTLFKSWFVDFDPVRAKTESRQPAGMDAEVAELFPDGFEESVLGKIPKGWQIATIGEVVQIVGGSTPHTQEPAYWEGGAIHWATPKDLIALSEPVLLNTERRITERGLQQTSSGLLPKGTVLFSSRSPIGSLAIAEIPVAINQGIIALVCNTISSNYYILRWIQASLPVIQSWANGTTFLEISKADLRMLPILLPPQTLVNLFANRTEIIHQQIVNNLNQSCMLASIRDSLLPKLLSGEVRIA